MVADEKRASERAAGHEVATGLGLRGHLGDRVKRGNDACGRDSSARCVSASLDLGLGLGPSSCLPPSVAGKGVCGQEGLCIPFTMGKAPFLRTGEWRPMATVLLTVVTCGLASRPIVSPGAVTQPGVKTRRLKGRTERAAQTDPCSQSESALSKGARTADCVAAATPAPAT